jgi:hypothetical protein
MKSMSILRWILIALSGVLAAFLVLRGNVVIGVLIGVMALTRAVLLVKMQHRREQFRRRIAARRSQYPGGRFPGRVDRFSGGQ